MRLALDLGGVMGFALATLLAGCGVDGTPNVETDVAMPALAGRAMGARQPISGASVSVVTMGTAGYGSAGTILATVTTDSGGNFIFPQGAYTCPQSNTPVYLIGVGGNAGAGTNSSVVLAAGLGACANAPNAFVIMNEVTTTALAFSLSHFFSTTLGGTNGGNDRFGGPSTSSSGTIQYSKGLTMGNSATIAALVNNEVGAPNQNNAGYTVEAAKINTIANILAACVNTTGSTSSTETTTPCGKLFNFTQNGANPRPSDTLQAAVQMALNPLSNVTNLFNLVLAQPPFIGLTTPPNDWTIGVSFTSSNLGLGVDTGTVGTLDIDSSGRIWFPSNKAGHVGAAYFDPASISFNGPFNTTGLVHPQQVVIDANGYAWYNDSQSATVAGYLTTAPATTHTVSMAGTVSNTLTVEGNNLINIGITNGTAFQMGSISADRTTYSLLSGVTFLFTPASMAGDVTNGTATANTNSSASQMRTNYVTSAHVLTNIVNANDYSGRVIYTGNDDIAVRSFAGAGSGSSADGLCIYSTATCYNIQTTQTLQNSVKGLTVSGAKNLWLSESANGGVLRVPVNTPSGTNGGIYVSGGVVPANEYLHGTGNGGTAPAPYGIGVDNTGNVWMINAGCNTTACTPGNFTLTEIVGAGYPTITPVSAQITNGNLVGTEPTQ